MALSRSLLSPHVLLLGASLSLGILSLVITEIIGINTPLGIILSAFLTPMATIGLIASAQHYYKRTDSPRFRTIVLLICFASTVSITVFLLPHSSMSSERLLYSMLRFWWLSLLAVCLGVLLRRSLLAASDNSASSPSRNVSNRKHSSDEEENDESSSLLGAVKSPASNAAAMKPSHVTWSLILIPILFALLSLVIPPFWTSDLNESETGVFGAFDVNIDMPAPSWIANSGWVELSFRYEIWLPLIAAMIILATITRSWSYLLAEIVVLVMLSVTCMMILILHGSSSTRVWYCNMGITACASGESDWQDDKVRKTYILK
jgi:hypothetical protein